LVRVQEAVSKDIRKVSSTRTFAWAVREVLVGGWTAGLLGVGGWVWTVNQGDSAIDAFKFVRLTNLLTVGVTGTARTVRKRFFGAG